VNSAGIKLILECVANAEQIFPIVCLEGYRASAQGRLGRALPQMPQLPQARAMLVMIVQRWQTAPVSMQMHVHKTRNAGQAKPVTGNLPDPSGSTPKPKSAPLKSETPHEIGGQLL